jgi:hypothetical protein
MCGTIDPVSSIRWVLGSGIKTGYDSFVTPVPWFLFVHPSASPLLLSGYTPEFLVLGLLLQDFLAESFFSFARVFPHGSCRQFGSISCSLFLWHGSLVNMFLLLVSQGSRPAFLPTWLLFDVSQIHVRIDFPRCEVGYAKDSLTPSFLVTRFFSCLAALVSWFQLSSQGCAFGFCCLVSCTWGVWWNMREGVRSVVGLLRLS